MFVAGHLWCVSGGCKLIVWGEPHPTKEQLAPALFVWDLSDKPAEMAKTLTIGVPWLLLFQPSCAISATSCAQFGTGKSEQLWAFVDICFFAFCVYALLEESGVATWRAFSRKR